jgi:hypothetical protein
VQRSIKGLSRRCTGYRPACLPIAFSVQTSAKKNAATSRGVFIQNEYSQVIFY